MMNLETTFAALHQLKVETGSLACLGCGHEESCSVRGCAILRAAEAHLHTLQAERDAAVGILADARDCEVCVHALEFNCEDGWYDCKQCPHTACICRTCGIETNYDKWEWKGPDHGKYA